MISKIITLSFIALLVGSGEAAAENADNSPDIQQLRDAIAKQQAQLDAQKQQLEKLEAAKVSTQDIPRVSMAYGRPTIMTADGSASLSFRAVVQADSAHYSQNAVGGLASDFRRGSVGTTPNRENNGARDLSDDTYFRRARFGIEGVINRDFNYRLMLELAGSGTEGPTRINDAWINYTGFAPFTIQLGAGAPPANMDDSTTPEDGMFIERASASDLSRSLAGADGRTGLGIRASGARWMSALTLTGRTVNDAEVYDSQNAWVGRAATLLATSTNYNVHVGASATYVVHAADAGLDAAGTRYGIRFRNQPELRVDSTRLIDTGGIDAAHAYAAGAELAANWRGVLFQAENFWYGIKRRNSTLANPGFGGYYLQRDGCSPAKAVATTWRRAHIKIRGHSFRFPRAAVGARGS
jgi:phosphate-selective porin OprO/OprP